MSLNCLIAYCVASINISVKHKVLTNKCPYSNYVVSILEKLRQKGIVKSYKVVRTQLPYFVEFELFYINDSFLISKIKLVSKPSSHIHMSHMTMKQYLNKYDNIIVSTDKGLLDYAECIKQKIGGKVLLGYR